MVSVQAGNIRVDRMLDIMSKKVRKCIVFLNTQVVETVKEKYILFVILLWMMRNIHIIRNTHLYRKYKLPITETT